MKKVFLLVVSIFFIGIHTSNAQSKKELKQQQKEKEYQEVKKLIESKNFVFSPDWVVTQRGRRINVAGDGNSLKVESDKATSDLPYFGVAQTASYGGGDGGVIFSNSNTEYTIEYDDKKTRVIIKFQAIEKSENFDVTMEIYGSGSTTVRISSSARNSISYNGKVSAINNN